MGYMIDRYLEYLYEHEIGNISTNNGFEINDIVVLKSDVECSKSSDEPNGCKGIITKIIDNKMVRVYFDSHDTSLECNIDDLTSTGEKGQYLEDDVD